MKRAEVIGYLESLPRFSETPGIFREEKLLQYLGNPEKKYPVIHITGTNGKGSAGAMIAKVLEKSGLKVGFYTSPHLEDYPERIHCGESKISWENLGETVGKVKDAAQLMADCDEIHPTEFDVLTAAGFMFFAKNNIDIAIVEVGIGGTLDSTNVVTPIVSIITNIEEDHLDRCGPTLIDLAHHKAGIIKKGIPVFSSVKEGELREIIRLQAKIQKAESYFLAEDWTYSGEPDFESAKEILEYVGKGKLSSVLDGAYKLSLLGSYQWENGALAISVLHYLSKKWPQIAENIHSGLSTVNWPGRFEVCSLGSQKIVIDGAHNQLGANSLRQALDEWFPGKSITFVLGFLEDKEASGFLQRIYRKGDLIFGVKVDSPRVMAQDQVLKLLQPHEGKWGETLEITLDRLTQLSSESVIVVCGSLYLVGPARSWVKKMFEKVEKGETDGFSN